MVKYIIHDDEMLFQRAGVLLSLIVRRK